MTEGVNGVNGVNGIEGVYPPFDSGLVCTSMFGFWK